MPHLHGSALPHTARSPPTGAISICSAQAAAGAELHGPHELHKPQSIKVWGSPQLQDAARWVDWGMSERQACYPAAAAAGGRWRRAASCHRRASLREGSGTLAAALHARNPISHAWEV